MRRSVFAGVGMAVLVAWQVSAGTLKLAPLFQDNLVLQRDARAPVWGWAAPGAKVSVTIGGQTVAATAGADGAWQVQVGAFAGGTALTLEVRSGDETLTATNVVAGDVWLCSGQSNMQFGLGGSSNGAAEIAAADFPAIRVFTVANVTAIDPQTTVAGAWQVCTPQNAGRFTAVGYFFGRELHRELKIPIGLIHSSWGGTRAEAWTSREALGAMPMFTGEVAQAASEEAFWRANGGTNGFAKRLAQWWLDADPLAAQKPESPAFDDAAWSSLQQPGAWKRTAALTNFSGIVWLRRGFDLPAAEAGKEGLLDLGVIGQQDQTYVNGRNVGSLTDGRRSRSYRVPAGVLKAGTNVVAVRICDMGAAGGFLGKPEELRLVVSGRTNALAGAWKYLPHAVTVKMPESPLGNPNRVNVLYNAMIAPLLPGRIKGAIWYQGESNAGRAPQYRALLSAMIGDWRARFGSGDFPFGIVQIANFMAEQAQPGENGGWAELREAQTQVAQTVTNCGLATIIDIGEAGNIHPRNKQDVGRRLALWALHDVYGRDVEYSGPVFTRMELRDGQAVLHFAHAAGLHARGAKPAGFAVAGPDKTFVWAQATIAGDTVVISAPEVKAPAAVRYGWANNPPCDLYNGAGLPAVPFRTDP